MDNFIKTRNISLLDKIKGAFWGFLIGIIFFIGSFYFLA